MTMLLSRLREQVLEANLELVRRGLVVHTFGNASAIARDQGLVIIKPSGVPYEEMRPEDLVVSDLRGTIVEGKLRASSDLPTHLVLYQTFPRIGAVAHTHSEYATSWAQARRCIPCLGTTHADYFHGAVPVTDALDEAEITSAYEENTGYCVVRAFKQLDYEAIPAVLVANHGPFTWGHDSASAVHNAVMLEAIARMAYFTVTVNHAAEPIGQDLHDKHYLRKHGSKAYYGQPRNRE
jgi:L-ribulose-5-phosphate 4-epimerase